ncbi:hypothetical protein [Streptomyces sp. NPDC016734]|uniref:hypothetical protein n=1 Tax=Streptomyces sp. NPDC016734 TaxID=3364971 RepID=UPI0037B8DF47
MSPDLRVVIYPPDSEGGRRVRVDGQILGRAFGPGDLLEFLRRASLDPNDVRRDDMLRNMVAARASADSAPS